MTESVLVYGDASVLAIRELDVELTDAEALAPAQFVKRIGRSEFRGSAPVSTGNATPATVCAVVT